jgi:hypothetical protein
MPSIAGINVDRILGDIPYPRRPTLVLLRPGLDVQGIFTGATSGQTVQVQTRNRLPAGSVATVAAGFRSLVGYAVTIVDGLGYSHPGVLVRAVAPAPGIALLDGMVELACVWTLTTTAAGV